MPHLDPMTVCVTCYGLDPRWIAQLVVWGRLYAHSGCPHPVIVLTDMSCPVPDDLPCPYTLMRIDLDAFPELIRPNQAFDAQGSIIAQAITRIAGPLVVMDTDCLVLRDPTEAFAALPCCAAIGMAKDAGGRPMPIHGSGIAHHEDVELNGGLLYFGDIPPELRKLVSDEYRHFFAIHRITEPTHQLLEQRVWSQVWYAMERIGYACHVPSILNWSHHWPMNDDVIIRHEHGSVKWLRHTTPHPTTNNE